MRCMRARVACCAPRRPPRAQHTHARGPRGGTAAGAAGRLAADLHECWAGVTSTTPSTDIMLPGSLSRAQALSIRADCRVTSWANFIRDIARANEVAQSFTECGGSLRFEVHSNLPNARDADPTRTPIAWRVGSAVQVRCSFQDSPGESSELVRQRSAEEREARGRAVAECSAAEEDSELVGQQLSAVRVQIARELSSNIPHRGTPSGDGWMGYMDRAGKEPLSLPVPVQSSPEYVLSSPRYIRIKQFYELLALMQESVASAAALHPHAADPDEICIGPPRALLSGMLGVEPEPEPEPELPLAEEEPEFCSVCLERRCDIVLSCAHAFCHKCMSEWRSSSPDAGLAAGNLLQRSDALRRSSGSDGGSSGKATQLGGSAPCPLCRATAGREEEEWELMTDGLTSDMPSAEASEGHLLRLQIHDFIRANGKHQP